jgi:hypothetical protein
MGSRSTLQFVKKFIDGLGVSMNLRPPDEKQFGELIAKAKKVQYAATLEGTLLQVWLRGGKAKTPARRQQGPRQRAR